MLQCPTVLPHIGQSCLPFCYDQFTTNFFLPDGSTGTVVGGSQKSAAGDIANLETGDYTLVNGQKGNIYSANPAAKPNTATLPLPSQFTASGVGSAIPVKSLGSKIILTYTTTLPGSTLPASTILPSLVPGTITSETILLTSTTTISAGTVVSFSMGAVTSISVAAEAASTIPGRTVFGSTVSPVVTTITTTTFGTWLASSSSTTISVSHAAAASSSFSSFSSPSPPPLPPLPPPPSSFSSTTPSASATPKKNDGSSVGRIAGGTGIWVGLLAQLIL